MKKRDCIVYKRSRLCYTVYGNGVGRLLAFHGFGQSGKVFSVFEKAYPGHTIYSFDLFGFGQSSWDEKTDAIFPSYWKALMYEFLEKEKIDRFSMVGFSLGAKLLLMAFEEFHLKIVEVLLIAPDGIKPSRWYRATTGFAVPNACFRYTIQSPKMFFHFIDSLKALRIIDTGTCRFVLRQMDSVQKRQKVYDVWMFYRFIRPSIPLIASQALNAAIPFTFFIGRRDQMLGKKVITRLQRKLPYAKVVEISGGHSALVEKTAQWLEADRD